MVLTIDIAVIATLITVLAAVAGFIAAGYKIYKRFEDLPDRVKSLEESLDSCNARGVDYKKLDRTLDRIDRKLANDKCSIEHITDCQVVMMEGMGNMYQHIINGNHSKEMNASYNKMMKELARISLERNADGN